MIVATPANYLEALNSLLKKNGLSPEDILWISNGYVRVSYENFRNFARRDTKKNVVYYSGIIVAGQTWWMDINHSSPNLTGRTFAYNFEKVHPEKIKEYELFLKRWERKEFLKKSKVKQFFYFTAG